MIYVKEYDCSENSQGIEFIGLTTFDNEREAFAYAEEQKKIEVYCARLMVGIRRWVAGSSTYSIP